MPASLARRIFVSGQVIGEVQRHQRLKLHALRHRGTDALAVGQRLRGRGNGRLEVRHDDGAAKLRGRVRHHGVQRRPIAHMQMPVIGAGDGEGAGLGGGGSHWGIVTARAARDARSTGARAWPGLLLSCQAGAWTVIGFGFGFDSGFGTAPGPVASWCGVRGPRSARASPTSHLPAPTAD